MKEDLIYMKRRVKALFMALVLMLTTVISLNGNYSIAKADDNKITVVFHLKAEDGNYAQFGEKPQLYYWTIGDGVANDMTVGADEATYTLVDDASTLKIGWIVRWGDSWDHKDIDSDRFVDVSDVVGGTVNVYITSGVSVFTVDKSAAETGVKLTSASSSDDLMSIDFASGVELSESDLATIKVRDNYKGGYLTVTSIDTLGEKKYSIVLADKLDITGSYTIEYLDGRTFLVSLPDYYATDEFVSQYTYTGDDLGATWSAASTTFKVWAPLATDVKVNLYESGTAGTDDLIKSVSMSQSDNGTWVTTVDGDLNGVYYTYTATVSGVVQEDIVDPYARTTGVNGNRGMVIDLDSTDPEGWENDTNPFTSTNYVDASIYELHIRDFSSDESSGITNKGKYLAFTETGTTNSYGQSTGIDYLKDLGVTHVHLLPSFDYASVDETTLETKSQYNWGYDPQNFNTPEGSYSTDPYNGEVRVKEFKQMVQSLHQAGIAVVMDVVYGHVNSSSDFSINRLTPSYYSRPNSSASGCGNDTATEREMNRKYIVDSMVYWATEYHVNGFRIDQEGLFDVDTINAVVEALHAIDPAIIVYGEGWDMSSTNTTKDVKLASQGSACDTIGSAYFSDSVRDGIKGGVFDNGAGYITGEFGKLSSIIDAIIANPGWQWDPNSVVNYNSCHDNYTLFDRIAITAGNEDASFEQRVKQNNLAAAMLYTMQGIPFIQAGEEILRTKPTGDGTYSDNSYNLPDSVNSLKWDTLNDSAYSTTHDYYKGLIAFRKAHAGLRMPTEELIDENLTFLLKGERDDSAIAFMINGGANGENSDGIIVIYNPSDSAISVDLPEGEWGIYIQDDKAGTDLLGTATGSVSVNATTCTVLSKNAGSPTNAVNNSNNPAADDNAAIVQTGDSASRTFVFVAVGFVAILAVAVLVVKRRKEFN
jgi:pullulanase